MGHEHVGVVEETGDSVKTMKVGEFFAQTIDTPAERTRNTCSRWSLTHGTAPGPSTSNLGTARLVGQRAIPDFHHDIAVTIGPGP